MLATSDKQKHFFQMVLAMKHGHKIAGVSKETQKSLHKAASSMSEKSAQDFADAPVKKKKSLLEW